MHDHSRVVVFAAQPRIVVKTVDSDNENSYHQETGTTMNTHTELSAKSFRGMSWARPLLLPAILALLPLFGSLNAQPIDLCSYPNGIELEIGGLDQITVEMPAGSKLKVIIDNECDPERSVDSQGGVYFSGTDAPTPSSIGWITGAYNTPDQTTTSPGEVNIINDSEFTVSLDACPGTKVTILCI